MKTTSGDEKKRDKLTDLSAPSFHELFNLSEIQSIQDAFASATGVASIITDTNGRPLTKPSNFCRLYSDIIRKTEKGELSCFHSDSVIGRYNPNGPIVQQCLSGGLWDAGASINVGGKHIANWLIGQIRNEKTDIDKMMKYAKEIGADEEDFHRALLETTFIPQKQFYQISQSLFLLANQLSRHAYQKINQEQIISKQRETEKALIKSEQKYRQIYNNILDVYYEINLDGIILEVSPSVEEQSHYTREELIGKSIYTLYTYPEARKELIDTIIRDGKVNDYEISLTDKDGIPHLCSLNAELIRDANDNPVKLVGLSRDITPRKKAEVALRESEERFKLAMEANRNGLWDWNINTDKVYYSPGYATMLGFVPGEIDLSIELWKDLIHPEAKGMVLKANQDCIENDRDHFKIKFRMRSKTGEWRWILGRGKVIGRDDDGRAIRMVGTHTDITESNLAQEALQASHKRFFTVLNSIDATIYVADMKTYKILFINKHMIETFGRDMTGELCWEVFRGEKGPCPYCPVNQLIDKNGKPSDLCVWQDKNPITGKWYINYDRMIEWTNGRLAKLQIATDITDLKKMETELSQTRKMESIGTLAGGIAHDFNNILGIILGNAELGLDDSSDLNEILDNINEIKIASLRAKDVVRQLLSFSRKEEQEQKPLDLLPVIQESVKLIRSSIPSSIEISVNTPPSCYVIHADETQIHQVIINLCTNAAHAMNENGGILDITVKNMILNGKAGEKYKNPEPGQYLELIIRDNGEGMDSETCKKIFDPYFTTKKVGKGTGLGLSVVHGIVQNHNGYIQVESKRGAGTLFSIIFPRVREVLEQDLIKEKDTLPHGSETILFVDDEQAIVDITQKVLIKLGYEVITETSPMEALNLFKANPDYFDLIICDMTMPGISGVVLSERLKAIRPDIPIVICTGHDSLLDNRRINTLGISAYAIKPVPISKLAQTIRDVLKTT